MGLLVADSKLFKKAPSRAASDVLETFIFMKEGHCQNVCAEHFTESSLRLRSRTVQNCCDGHFVICS